MNFNFVDFWDTDLDNKVLKQEQEFFKLKIEQKDYEIFKSQWRKDKGYIPHAILPRTIITKFGKITYYRRLYRFLVNQKWDYVFLTDNFFDVNKYQRIHQTLKFNVLNNVCYGSTQSFIAKMLSNANISSKSISNIINSVDLRLLNEPDIYFVEKVKINDCLYINVDETYCNLRVNKKIKKCRIRIAVFHTGVLKIKNRNHLLNKRIYLTLTYGKQKIDTKKFVNDALNFARNFYNNVDTVVKVIGGDSALWIKTLTDYIDNSLYIADKFHLIRDLRILKSNQKEIVKLLENGNYQDLILKLTNKFNKLKNPTRLQNIAFSTIKNNVAGITNQSSKFNVGTFAESNVSILKSLFGFNNKVFNLKTFQNMLILRLAKINGLSILDLLKKEIKEVNNNIKSYYRNANWKVYKEKFVIDYDFPLLVQSKQKSNFIRALINQ